MKKIVSLFGVVFLFATVAAEAQTPRRTPRPLVTPLPTLTGAEIISRSSDLDEPNVQPTPRPTQKNTSTRLRELNDRVDRLESKRKVDNDESQRRMLLNLDILTRAEQRSDSLRKQLFDMIEKENNVAMRLDQIGNESRPEYIERAVQIAGSLRPEEVRESRRKSLDAEKANLDLLMVQIRSTKASLQVSLDKADQLVEKLRTKLEKEIDETYLNDAAGTEKPEKPDNQF